MQGLAIFWDVVVFVVLTVSGALLAGGEPEQDVTGSALIGVAVFTAIAVCKFLNIVRIPRPFYYHELKFQ